MKQVLLFFFFTFFLNGFQAQLMDGYILDIDSKDSLSDVSIELLHNKNRVFTDQNGHFKFQLTHNDIKDTLKISAVGFETIIIPIEYLLQNFDMNLIIKQDFELQSISKMLDEATVFATAKYKTVLLGNRTKSKAFVSGDRALKSGFEMGTVMKYNQKKKGKILNVNFNMALNENFLNAFVAGADFL